MAHDTKLHSPSAIDLEVKADAARFFTRSRIAGGMLALFIATAGAAHLADDVVEARVGITAMSADEGTPHNLVTAMNADEGVPHNLLTAMNADDGVPHNLLTAMNADEGVPHNLVAALPVDEGTPFKVRLALQSDEGVPHNLGTA